MFCLWFLKLDSASALIQNLADLLVDSFARAVAEAEELAFIAGTGHDNQQPEGFTKDATLAAATVTTAAAGAVTIDKRLYCLGLADLSFTSPTTILNALYIVRG
ncbi:MAG: phage major capsid protein [Dehalococcoidia bacterium]|nr:phage major capsid protein [Dehalococcoidia bacterium]